MRSGATEGDAEWPGIATRDEAKHLIRTTRFIKPKPTEVLSHLGQQGRPNV
jgi:hypothetical protein